MNNFIQEYVTYLNQTLGILAIILQFLSLLAILFLIFFYKKEDNFFLNFIKENFLLIGFVISSGSVIMSLFYSQIIGYAPCNLCWMQRIFMFPQVVLFGIGYLTSDKKIINYSLPLLITGFLIAIYHNFIYYFAENSSACDASLISCIQQLVHEFGGYISFPSLSLTSFTALLILLGVAYFYKKNEN